MISHEKLIGVEAVSEDRAPSARRVKVDLTKVWIILPEKRREVVILRQNMFEQTFGDRRFEQMLAIGVSITRIAHEATFVLNLNQYHRTVVAIDFLQVRNELTERMGIALQSMFGKGAKRFSETS